MVMYKIDRRGVGGGVQKSFSRTDPPVLVAALGPEIGIT